MYVRLVKPSVEYREEYLEMLAEWQETGEQMIPWVLNEDPSDFEAMVAKFEDQSNGFGLQEGHVPASTFWLVRDDGKVLGAANIRHYLNKDLEYRGGHIGQGIRPSERRKGYGTEMLRLALEVARNKGITAVLVTCDVDNIASAQTILKNGGELDSEGENERGPFQRYWIQLE
jgi:predicted acetyltransferase